MDESKRPLGGSRGALRVLAFAAIALAAGCNGPPPPVSPQESAAMAPTDARLASIYESSCRACHAEAASGAPLTGNREHWDPRWKKGLPALVRTTVTGLNGMPPGGQCVSCTPADYEALIRFMAGR